MPRSPTRLGGCPPPRPTRATRLRRTTRREKGENDDGQWPCQFLRPGLRVEHPIDHQRRDGRLRTAAHQPPEQQSAINAKISDYQTINSQLWHFSRRPTRRPTPPATSRHSRPARSNSAGRRRRVTSGTQSGTLTFAVDQLATGSTQITAGTVASPNDVVASGNLLVASGGSGARHRLLRRRVGTGLRCAHHHRDPVVVRRHSQGHRRWRPA